MLDAFRQITLSISQDEFRILPGNAAYKYEYLNNRAILSPRPTIFRGVLDLDRFTPSKRLAVIPLPRTQLPSMGDLFFRCFRRTQPIASLSEEAGRECARQCLERTFTDGDGPLIEDACFQIQNPLDKNVIAAILITLCRREIATDWRYYEWDRFPTTKEEQLRLGVPHLTWIFVDRDHCSQGYGTALLAASVEALIQSGYQQLTSTFMLGNDSSIMWHWRNGFRLQPLMSAIRECRAPDPEV